MRRHLTPYSGSEGQELKAILVGCLRMTFARYCSALLQFNRGRCRERPARSRLSPFEVMDAHGARMLRPRGRKASGNYAGWVWQRSKSELAGRNAGLVAIEGPHRFSRLHLSIPSALPLDRAFSSDLPRLIKPGTEPELAGGSSACEAVRAKKSRAQKRSPAALQHACRASNWPSSGP